MKHLSAVSLRSLYAPLVLLCVPVVLTGCSGFGTTATPTATLQGAAVTITGDAHGGQQPLINSQIYLFTPGTTGYGSASTSLLSTSNNASATGTNAAAYVYTGGLNGADYVLTTSSGHFIINGDFACPTPSAQVYALAYSGNPTGSAANNATDYNNAIALIAPVGTCSSLGSQNIAINELTTVATVTAAQQFITDATHIGASAANAQGLTNAFNIVNDLVTLSTGAVNTANVAGTGTVPTAKINELGNILATCVNTPGDLNGSIDGSGTPTPCDALFSATATAAASTTNSSASVTCPGATGCPTDTLQAMLQIAKNPTQNTATLHALPTSATLVFGPDASNAPNDYGLNITYSGGGLYYPESVAIDAQGDAYVSCGPSNSQMAQFQNGVDAIVGISPRGVFLADYTKDVQAPAGIAFDLNGNLWVADSANEVYYFSGPATAATGKDSTTGTVPAGFPYTAGLSTPLGIALDVNNNAWVTNETGGTVYQITPSGTLGIQVTETRAFGPVGVGIDSNANVFVSGAGASKISRNTTTNGTPTLLTNSVLNQPSSISIDANDNVWSWNQSGATSELVGTSTGTATTNGANNTYHGVANAEFLAIDGAGTAWIPDCEQINCGNSVTAPDKLIHVAANGANLNYTNAAGSGAGLQDTTNLNGVGTLAFDGSGNLWVTNAFGATVTEYIGVAAPVATPLVSAVKNNQLGARP